jgi:hypothetical protein
VKEGGGTDFKSVPFPLDKKGGPGEDRLEDT